MSDKIVYRCNICFSKFIFILVNKGNLLTSCGCFYCTECFKDCKSYITCQSTTCVSCTKPIDFKKTVDINNKESLQKIEFIYDDPEVQLKKIIEIIKVF